MNTAYILLIRRYRVTSGRTLPARMAPSPTAAATSTKIFICQVSLLSPVAGVIGVHLLSNTVQRRLITVQLSRPTLGEDVWIGGAGPHPTGGQPHHLASSRPTEAHHRCGSTHPPRTRTAATN